MAQREISKWYHITAKATGQRKHPKVNWKIWRIYFTMTETFDTTLSHLDWEKITQTFFREMCK